MRRLERSDIPRVCDLFVATFRAGRNVSRDDVEQCLASTYLTSPQDRHRPASLVDARTDGRIVGFMGIIGFAAQVGGRSLRAGVLGNFMAEPEHRARSGIGLARATLRQTDLDFMFSDTANRTSMDLASALRFVTLPLHSLEWIKLLRPFSTAAYRLGRSSPLLGRVATPMAWLGDIGLSRMRFARPSPVRGPGVSDRDIDAAGFAAAAPSFIGRYSVRPDWGGGDLAWVLDQASKKTSNGPLRLRMVRDANGGPIGLYAVYLRRGGVAHALQVLSLEDRQPAVVEALIRYAASMGALAVRGSLGPGVAAGIFRQRGILCHHVATTMAYAHDPALRQALTSGDAFLGGLFGEGWTRLVADEFVFPRPDAAR